MVKSIDIDDVRARADAVLTEPLCWFPVRHHSPTVAHHLKAAILERRPKVLFLEAPADAAHLVKHIVDDRTKPPIAMYTSYRDDDNTLGLAGLQSAAKDIPARFSSWYPLMSYSPEYVAMKTAAAIGCEVVFIDLPRSALLQKQKAEDDSEAESPHPQPLSRGRERGGAESDEDDDDFDDIEDAGDVDVPQRGESWEAVALSSRFYVELAASAGYRTWNEAWDALFEDMGRHAGWREYRADLAYFCASVRATTSTARLAGDGTIERERHMRSTIEDTLRDRQIARDAAMVVCGGFHLFLDRFDVVAAPARQVGTHYATVAPWSYFRVSEKSGYGAANRAPRWYELWHEHCAADPAGGGVEAMLAHVVAVLSRGRKDASGLSSADAIAVCQHARMLAALRGRRQPVLDDVRDALVSCCCKGRPEEEGAPLMAAMEAVEIGSAIGRVTTALGQLPLVHDFYTQLDELELGEVMGKEKKLHLKLDLRIAADERRSVFFHRLVHLGVGLAKSLDEPGYRAGLFAETWELVWTPRVEESLIENNLYGDTVEAAAIGVLEEELAKDELHAGRACERLVRSRHMNLPGLVTRLEQACGAAIDDDKRFSSLAQAMSALMVLDRHAAHAQLSRALITEMIGRSYARACFLIPDVASVPEEEHKETITALQSIAEALLGTWAEGLDPQVFIENVRTASSSSTSPFLQGALRGLLVEIRAETPEALAGLVSAYARGRPDTLVQAGAFLDGVMAVSKTSLMLGAEALVGAVDELLRAADEDAFRTLLPQVRNAFERLHERQRDSLAARVAERYGLKDAAQVTTLHTSVDALAELARLDQRVAEIMKAWDL
ncbi:MAG: DUF5682 family protein [Deltaproteobacteria bacterium]|nr:DUF5682 family protein [Deltaproteobacteria bacterium]